MTGPPTTGPGSTAGTVTPFDPSEWGAPKQHGRQLALMIGIGVVVVVVVAAVIAMFIRSRGDAETQAERASAEALQEAGFEGLDLDRLQELGADGIGLGDLESLGIDLEAMGIDLEALGDLGSLGDLGDLRSSGGLLPEGLGDLLAGLDELTAQLEGQRGSALAELESALGELDDVFSTLPEVLGSLPVPGGGPAGDHDLFAAPQAAQLIADVAAEVGASGVGGLRLYQVLLYPDYAFVKVQDPAVPAHVDEYSWRRGAFAAPSPVRLSASEDLDAKLFDATDVDWDAIARIAAAIPELTDLADGRISHVNIERPLPFGDAVRLRIFVSGARGSGYIDATASGEVIDVVRS